MTISLPVPFTVETENDFLQENRFHQNSSSAVSPTYDKINK